jgi:cell division protein FtsL
MLLAAAVLATLYISNAIAVNDLMTGIASLEKDRDAARASNEKLRAELLKLMAVERVTSIASTRLGMVQPVRPPLSLGAEAHAADPAPSPDQPPAVDSAVVR